MGVWVVEVEVRTLLVVQGKLDVELRIHWVLENESRDLERVRSVVNMDLETAIYCPQIQRRCNLLVYRHWVVDPVVAVASFGDCRSGLVREERIESVVRRDAVRVVGNGILCFLLIQRNLVIGNCALLHVLVLLI